MSAVVGRTTHPLVSIGVPIFNEAALLRVHVEELTKQSYENLEILIFDNASDAESFNIAGGLCAQDPRVSVFRHPENVGGEANFAACFRAASGEFFTWAQPDDGHDRDYIARGVQELQLREDAVSVTAPDLPYCKWAVGSRKWRTAALAQDSVQDRVRAFFDIAWSANAFVSGLHRRTVLEPLVDEFHSFPGDWVVLLGLLREGKLLRTAEGRMVIGDSGQSNSVRRFSIQRKNLSGWLRPFGAGQARTLTWQWNREELAQLRRGWRSKNRAAARVQIEDELRNLRCRLTQGSNDRNNGVSRRRYIDHGLHT